MKIIISFGFALISCSIFAQSQTHTFNVNFAYDKHELRPQEKAKLDSIFYIQNITQINLAGHTDSDGNNEYNLILSEKRVAEVRRYLIGVGLDERVITTGFFGENAPKTGNTTETGKAENRRVEVRVFYEKEIKIVEEKPPVPIKKPIRKPIRKPIQKPVIEEDIPEKQPEPKQPKPKRDTVFAMDDLQVIISKSDYEKFKDCLVITSTMTGDEAYQSGMETVTTEGVPLMSCGMASVQLAKPCEGCFDKPIKVRYRMPEPTCDPCGSGRRLYVGNSEGTWSRARGSVKRVKVDGEYFYEMTFYCPNSYNCDCKKVPPLKQKFKMPKGYKLTTLNVVYDCPILNYEFDKIRRRKAKGKLLACWIKSVEGYVYLNAKDTDGNLIEVERIPLKDLKHGRKKYCEVKIPRKMRRKKTKKEKENYLYRKYCISREQIEEYQVKRLIYNNK